MLAWCSRFSLFHFMDWYQCDSYQFLIRHLRRITKLLQEIARSYQSHLFQQCACHLLAVVFEKTTTQLKHLPAIQLLREETLRKVAETIWKVIMQCRHQVCLLLFRQPFKSSFGFDYNPSSSVVVSQVPSLLYFCEIQRPVHTRSILIISLCTEEAIYPRCNQAISNDAHEC